MIDTREILYYHEFESEEPTIEECDYESCIFANGDEINIEFEYETYLNHGIYHVEYYDSSVDEWFILNELLVSNSFMESVLFFDIDHDNPEEDIACNVELDLQYPAISIPVGCGLFKFWHCVHKMCLLTA